MKQDWSNLLRDEMKQVYFCELLERIDLEYATQMVYPPRNQIFTALEQTGYHDTKVVLLGQDPYHGARQAHGLSFSVADNSAQMPPSLRNIFKELAADLGIQRERRNLSDWAEQGVLLLNTVLTVRAGQAGSHCGLGWERFTDTILRLLNAREAPVVFVLWGNSAQAKRPLINESHHSLVLSAHPSPLSAYRGFFGSRPFGQINRTLAQWGETQICWGEEASPLEHKC